MERKTLLPLAMLFAVFVVAASTPFVNAAVVNVTFTVTKDNIPCANSTIAFYEVVSKYYGLYNDVGAFIASGKTDANGLLTVNGTFDSAKTYLAKITYAGKTYEQKFTPAAEVAIKLTETSWLRGNIVPLLLGGAAVFILLFVIAQVNPRLFRFGR